MRESKRVFGLQEGGYSFFGSVWRLGPFIVKPVHEVDLVSRDSLTELSRRTRLRVPRPLWINARIKVLTFVRGTSYPDGNPPGSNSTEVLAGALRLYIRILKQGDGLRLSTEERARDWPTFQPPRTYVAHLDPHPSNFSFRSGKPWGLFDFDFIQACSAEVALAAFIYHWTPFVPDDLSPFKDPDLSRRERLQVMMRVASEEGVSPDNLKNSLAEYFEWRISAIRWHGRNSDPLRRWLEAHEFRARRACEVLVEGLF